MESGGGVVAVVVDRAVAVGEAIAATAFIRDAMAQTLNWQWTDVQLFSDDPAKALGAEPPESLLINRLKPVIADARTSFDLVSGYFVPADFGTSLLTGLAARRSSKAGSKGRPSSRKARRSSPSSSSPSTSTSPGVPSG